MLLNLCFYLSFPEIRNDSLRNNVCTGILQDKTKRSHKCKAFSLKGHLEESQKHLRSFVHDSVFTSMISASP